MSSTSDKHPPASTAETNDVAHSIPHCHKGMTETEVTDFIQQVMSLFHKMEDMSDLNTLYQVGKQLSRLYFDVSHLREEIAVLLVNNDFPAFSTKMMKKLNNLGVFKNDDIWFSSFYFYNVNWNFADCNARYATALAHAGLPHLLCLNIGHQPYLDNLASKNVYYLIKASLSIMLSIARVPGNAHYFSSESVKKFLQQLSQREEDFIRCVSTLTLSYVLSEQESEVLQKGSRCVTNILKFIESALTSEKRRYSGYTVDELVSALGALAMNDAVSREIVDNRGAQVLKSLCTPAHPKERESATRVLWTLLFLEENRKFLIENLEISQFFQDLKKNSEEENLTTSSHAALNENIDSALWMLSQQQTNQSQTSNHREYSTSGFDVFVSYCPHNREPVLSMVDRLRERGIRCCVDPQEKFSAVADLVAQCRMVLVCMSEAYKMSPACRMAAEYAASRHLALVPVLLQYKYKPDGWLSTLLGTKVYYDFSGRRDVNAAFEQLLATVSKNLEIVADIVDEAENTGNKGDEKVAKQAATDALPPMSPVETSHEPPQEVERRPSHPSAAWENGGPPSQQQVRGHTQSFSEFEHPQPHSSCSSNAVSGPGATSTAQTPRGGTAGAHSQLMSPKHAVPLPGTYATSLLPEPPSYTLPPSVLEWSTEEMQHWLQNNQLAHVAHEFKHFNGKLLEQMVLLRQEAPDYFFHALDVKLRLNLVDILRFCAALNELMMKPQI